MSSTTPSTGVALQLYTLREFCKTPANIAATMRRVRQIGYAAVQASGLGPIEPVELRRIFDGEGLVCCATHRSLEQLESDPNRVIDEHATLGCRYTAIGGFFLPSFTAGDWAEFITRYNAIAKRYAGSALAIGYHNHHHEFARFDGMPAMQRLIDELDRSVWIELDTYWVQHGGGDPAAWIGKVRGRLPCVHLKDMTVTADKKQVMAEVGEGNLNWPAILEACRAAGVEWYIVEQDTCQRDPFESIAISLHNVHAMGLR